MPKRNFVVRRVGQPYELQRRGPERHLRLDGPQRNAPILRLRPHELAEREGVDDIEHAQPVGLAPDDLLLADAHEGAADVTVDIQLPQLGVRGISEQPTPIEVAALALLRPAGFEAIFGIDACAQAQPSTTIPSEGRADVEVRDRFGGLHFPRRFADCAVDAKDCPGAPLGCISRSA